MSCLGLKENGSVILYKFPKISKWKIFRRRKYSRNLHRHRNSALMYVDELYTQPTPVQAAVACQHVEIPEEVTTEPEKGVMGKIKRSQDPVLIGINSEPSIDIKEVDDVDLRAEMFIRKFKEDMRKQRLRSSGDC